MIDKIRSSFRSLWNGRQGQDMVEYALLGGMVASMAVAIFPAISATSGLFSQSISALALALSTTAGQ